jgi:hypothetical protein
VSGTPPAAPAGPGPAKLVKVLVGELGRSGPRARRGTTAGRAAPTAEVAERAFTWSAQGPQPVVEEPSGKTTSEGAGTDEAAAEPALTLSLSPDDAQAVREGRLAPSVAFMQGRLKTSGDNALLLEVLAWTATPGFRPAVEVLATAKDA